MYKEIVDHNFECKNFTVKEQNVILVLEISNNYLDASKLEELHSNILNVKDETKNCLILMKNFIND